MSREEIMELDELEMLNRLTAPRAERALRMQRVIDAARWCMVFAVGLLLGLAL